MVANSFLITQNPHPEFALNCNTNFPVSGFDYSISDDNTGKPAAMHQQRQ